MKKITLTPELLHEFRVYIRICMMCPEIRDTNTLTDLLFFNLLGIDHQLEVKTLDVLYKNRKKVTVKLNYSDIVTLSYMFKIKPVSAYFTAIEYEILNGVEATRPKKDNFNSITVWKKQQEKN